MKYRQIKDLPWSKAGTEWYYSSTDEHGNQMWGSNSTAMMIMGLWIEEEDSEWFEPILSCDHEVNPNADYCWKCGEKKKDFSRIWRLKKCDYRSMLAKINELIDAVNALMDRSPKDS